MFPKVPWKDPTTKGPRQQINDQRLSPVRYDKIFGSLFSAEQNSCERTRKASKWKNHTLKINL